VGSLDAQRENIIAAFLVDFGRIIRRPAIKNDSSAILIGGRTIWIADAHRDDGHRFIVQADEKLTALLELESVILCLPRGPKVKHRRSKYETTPA
jgi:hypothetical protein